MDHGRTVVDGQSQRAVGDRSREKARCGQDKRTGVSEARLHALGLRRLATLGVGASGHGHLFLPLASLVAIHQK
jgi:hypothetical protein